jgi:hypothetical protein
LNWSPIAPEALSERVAGWLADTSGTVRVAVDGAPAADPGGFAESLRPHLERFGRPVAHVRAATFWRDASLRLEHGREDVESYLTAWLDADALEREVLNPAQQRGEYLPSLRDPQTNRSTREPPRSLLPGSVVIVSGTFLLGRGLSFDRTVHLALSPAALARRTPTEAAWTLPAYGRYETDVRPAESADVLVKLEDPRRPALRCP